MSALENSEERREYRRVSDAISLRIIFADEAANDTNYDGAELPDYPTHVVSLSPNGLKCYFSEPFADDDILDISFMVFPSKTQINTKAKVVNSGEDEKLKKNNRFFAGLSFIDMSEEDREHLLEHIDGVARQSFGGAVKLVNRS